MQRWALVGGGYSAAALLLSLSDRLHPTPLRRVAVDVYEPRGTLGHGLAYTPWEHEDWGPLLNVPAGRMGATVSRQDGFAQWWAHHGGRAADFAPRAAFGRYLHETLNAALATTPQLQVTHHRMAVQALHATAQGWHVHTAAGTRAADGVVLATGHEARGLPPGAWHETGWWADPWTCGDALDALPTNAPVLLIGTGLTAVDVWQRLMRRPGASEGAPVLMASRHGWLPQGHRPHDAPPPQGFLPDDVLANVRTAPQMLRGLRELAQAAGPSGLDWRDVMADLRRHTPRLWQQLPCLEQQRALRHGTAAWDSHRHRAAPEVAAQLQRALNGGQLQVSAARLARWERCSPDAWMVSLQHRQGDMVQHRVAAVINCTGPSPASSSASLHLREQGRAAGWYQPHANGLGPRVDELNRMVGADGAPSASLWALGPTLRATHWEATAVPELRQHADLIARQLTSVEEAEGGP